MKDIFMQMREEEFEGNVEEYTNQLDELNHQEEEEQKIENNVLCPNCFKADLVFDKKSDSDCTKCGQSFILIGPNQVRFK